VNVAEFVNIWDLRRESMQDQPGTRGAVVSLTGQRIRERDLGVDMLIDR
jgi:hypothetical protein